MPPLLGDRDLNAAHVGENDTASFKMPKSASDTQVAQKELRAKEIAALQLGGDGSKISPGKMARRSMQPRKSILKPLGRSESDDTLTFNHTGSFGRVSNVSGSMHDRGEHTVSFPARRVSFAPNAHVRMFENQTKPKRKSIAFAPPPPAPTDAPAGTGAGSSGQARRQSRGSASHSRQASITDLSTIHLPPSLTAGPAAPRASIAPRSSLAAAIPDRFVGEGDSLGEEAMDISVSDAGDVTVEDAGEGDESGEVSMEISDGRSMILPSYTAPIPRPPFALGARTSTGARLSLSRSNSDDSVSVPNAAARSSIGASGMRQSIGGGIDEEEAMDLTVAMGGILPSAPADASFEGEGEGDTTIISASTDPDAERTMEFTIAVGGIMPSTPPTHAARGGRVSLGYSNPGHDASLQRLVPGQSMEGDEEDDEEVGMEETVAFGGILRDGQDDTMSSEEGDNVAGRERERTQTFNFGSNEVSLGHKQIQLPEVEADMSVDMADEDDEDDEEGMEITEAHGGILRRQSMVTATANHTHASSSGHTASLSMVSSTTRNIFAPVSPAYIAPTSGPIGTPSRHLTSSHNTGTPSFARPTVSSARKSRPSLSSTHLSAENIHARAETSLSGNGKEKRNVFAPSPSPTKKSTTPRKSIGAGAAAARDVAKRLSFAPSNIHMGGIGQESGSPEKSVRPIMLDEFGNEYDAEMSVGRKRKADEDRTPSSTPASVRRKVLGGGAVVVQRVENVFAPNGNVFAPATSTNPKPVNASASAVAPAQGTPRKSLPAHMYLASIGQSPAKSPMLRKMIGAAPSASAVEDEDEAELVSGDRRGNANEHEQVIGQEERQEEEEGEGDFQPIPLSAFLEMADIRFTMDDVGVSGVSGPSRKSMGARARQSYTGKFIFMSCEREFALHEYAAASVQNGFVNMYTWACSKMRADISASTSEISSIEADCAIFNPPVIREYLGATDDDKQLFEMTFKQYRANQQLIARGRFYAWKLDMLTRVGPDVEGVLEGMREDKARLDEMQQTTTRLLPELQAKLAALQEDLVREREAVKEIEACDAGELEGLRESITEQNGFLKALETDVSESASSLSRLETTLADLATSKTEHLSAITTARGLCDQYTKSDVLRLQDELHAVQAMHRWEIESVDEGLLRVVYDREVVLTVPLTQTAQAVQGKEEEGRVEFRNEKEGDEVMRGLKEVFGSAVRVLKVRGLGVSRYIQQVGQLYTSICRIRSEIRLLNVHFPITTVLHTLNDATNTAVFEVRASVMFTELRSRVEVVFAYDEGVLKAWPEGVATGQVWVERVYGAADPETLTAVARDVMSTATPEGYFGYMVQTCVDVSTSR